MKDKIGTLPCVCMMEIEIFVDFSPLRQVILRVPFSDILWVLATNVSHDSMAFSKPKTIGGILDCGKFAHRIYYFIFFLKVFKFTYSDLFNLILNFGNATERPDSSGRLRHVVNVKFYSH